MNNADNNLDTVVLKCSIDGTIVNPCNSLSKTTEFGNPRGKQKGIFAWVYYQAPHKTTSFRSGM
jgi:hypothetical protein